MCPRRFPDKAHRPPFIFAPVRNTSGFHVGLSSRSDETREEKNGYFDDISTALQNRSVLRSPFPATERWKNPIALFSTSIYSPVDRLETRYLAFTLPYVLSHHLSSCVRRAGPKRLQGPATTARLNSIKDHAVARDFCAVAWVRGHWHFVTIIQLYRFYINTYYAFV